MATIDEFKIGDRIENSYGCRGRVVEIGNDAMRATYTERGGSWTETYDAAWFRSYGQFLKILRAA